MENILYALIPVTAFMIDAIYGDPRSDYHPVVLIGRVISFWESKLYPKIKTSDKNMYTRGCIEVFLVFFTIGTVTHGLVYLSQAGGILLYFSVSSIILYFTITPRALARDGMEIYHLLKSEDLRSARSRLSWIVGRDTDQLDEGEISRGTIETVAENTTDGIISPLFYFLLFGPVGAMMYRAGNTMDSMLGYKNKKYLFFGRAAARIDDVLNYVPARITYLLFIAAAFILRLDWKNAVYIGRRDASKHPSPNGGYAEATVAGAMHIRLGGYNYYEGKPEFREYMGDPGEALNGNHIKKSIIMMYTATAIFIAVESLFLMIW